MTILPQWLRRPSILMNNPSNGPWGGGDDGDGGPRNPWAVPPGGRKGTPKPTALDEFLKKARGGPGGGDGMQVALVGDSSMLLEELSESIVPVLKAQGRYVEDVY